MFDLFKKFGITRVFEDVANKDANDPNASGGDNNNKDRGVAGGGKPAEDKTTKDQTYELKVGGETRHVTLEEMRVLAQKSGGADKKFEDASALRKQADDGIRMQELVQRLSDKENPPTEADVKELATMMGVDPSEFNEYLNPEDTPQGGDKTANVDPKVLADALGMEPAEAKMILELSKQGLVASEREKITKNSHLMVDKDEFFGKIKIGKGGDGIIEAVKEMVAEDVFERIEHGGVYGAELVAASIQKIRAHLIKMGIPGKPDEHPIVLGLVPGGATLPAEVSSDTPIERVSAADDESGDNFVKRYMQKAYKAIRENASK